MLLCRHFPPFVSKAVYFIYAVKEKQQKRVVQRVYLWYNKAGIIINAPWNGLKTMESFQFSRLVLSIRAWEGVGGVVCNR